MSLLALQSDFRDWLVTETNTVANRCGPRAAFGLGVYLNTYRAQLMAALSESYATTHAWLGDAAFEAAAATYIDRAPPGSWTMDAYGADFATMLAQIYPDDPEISDLAALERALATAFTAADAAPLDTGRLADIDWDRARLCLAPSLALLPTTSNAGAIWSAIAAGGTPPPAARLPEPTAILVWREGFTPAFRTLDPAEASALEALRRGADFGSLCALLVERLGENDGPGLAGHWLATWLADGIIADIAVTE